MKVIVVASQKGGAGKTTMTSHLAIEAERVGAGPVAIIDTDPQGGLAAWWNVRKADTPVYARPPSGPDGLRAQMEALKGQGFELVLIDTPPQVGEAIGSAVEVADLVLIPVRPSPNDLRAVPGTVRIVEAQRKPMCFIINGVKPRVRLTGETAVLLSSHGTVAPQNVYDRTLYASAMADGRTAPEIDPQGDAAREMAALWAYVSLRLEGRTAHVEASAA